MITVKKISVVALFAIVLFGTSFLFVSNVSAQTTGGGGTGCSGCGGGSTGDGGNNDGGSGNRDTPPPVAPTCDLTLNITQVDNIGDMYRLEWVGTPSSASFFINGSAVAATGHANFTFTGPNYDRFRMTGNNQGLTCQDDVEVTRRVQVAPTCDLFTATPENLPVGGGDVTLRWETTNATNATIDGERVAGNGTLVVNNVTSNRTFTLNLSNAVGQASCTTSVVVTPPVVPITPACTLSAASTTIVRGSSTNLTWTSSNTVGTASITNVMGTVNPRDTVAFSTVSPTVTTTYTMTVTSATGNTATCTRTITVTEPPVTPTFSCANNVNLSASPTSIRRGNSSTITWTTTGVTSLSFNNGITKTILNGSETVTPSNSTTYTMTISNGTQTDTCPVTVNVSTSSGGGGGSATPRCELKASTKSVSAGGKVTLEWKTSNSTELILKDSFGKTLVSTEGKLSNEKRNLYDDSIVVNPTKDTKYTLTVSRGSRDRVCTVEVDVKGDIIVTEVRDQKPVVTGIALTQVPYTGFEAGPIMTLAFYALLVLWALYLAYILMIRRTPTLASVATDTSVTKNSDFGQTTQPDVFVPTTATPNFHAPAVAPVVPENVQYGYAGGVVNDDEATEIENRAHEAHVLFSGEAMRHFMATTNKANRMEVLAVVLEEAKASYPAEDGWVVLNEERMAKLCTDCVATATSTAFTPSAVAVGNSSLAEAIVTGNIVAAYQLIGNRPMIALTDAVADLDALYRAKQGADVTVSKMLAHADVKSEQLHTAITALTSALDGTYTDEAEAVKMAIMKAVKALNS